MITYWSFTDIAAFTGLSSNALRQRQFRGTFPKPDAMVGAVPGWKEATIKKWWAAKTAAGPETVTAE